MAVEERLKGLKQWDVVGFQLHTDCTYHTVPSWSNEHVWLLYSELHAKLITRNPVGQASVFTLTGRVRWFPLLPSPNWPSLLSPQHLHNAVKAANET